MPVTSTITVPSEILTVYSRQAILEAQPVFQFRQFVDVKTELRREAGRTIQFTKHNNIAKGGIIPDEFSLIPRQRLSASTVSITVYEFGNSIEWTREQMEYSFRDTMSDAAEQLGRDYANVLDDYLRDIFLATANVQYAGRSPNDAGITSTEVFNTDEIKDAVETLKTLNVPPVMRGNGDRVYVCFAHPHQLRTLRDDTFWISAHQYTDPSAIFNGEVGRYENVIFIETTQMPISVGTGGGGINIYSAVMFGAKAIGFAESVPMQLIQEAPRDFGRFYPFAWYSIMGAGIINDYIVEIRTA